MTRSVSFKPLGKKALEKEFNAFDKERLLIPIEVKQWAKENRSKFQDNRYIIIGYIGDYHGYLMERIFAVRFNGNKMQICETGRRFYDRTHGMMPNLPYCGMYRGYMPEFHSNSSYEWNKGYDWHWQVGANLPNIMWPAYICNEEQAIEKYGKYSAWELYKGNLPLYDYLVIYQMCPGIEYLVKKGWSALVPWWKQLNPKGRDISTLAKIPKVYEKALVDGRLSLLQIRSLHNYPFKDIEQAEDYLNYVRYNCYYISSMNFEEKIYLWKKHASHYGYETEYVDYLRMAKELNYPLDNSWYHFPSSYEKLVALHDRAVVENRALHEQLRAKELADQREQFIKAVAPFSAYEWKEGGMIAVAAKEPSDLITEGRTLNHCVGSYVGKVSRGETMIFFIRHADEPEKPYVTLELRDRTITQVYGNHDTMPKKDAVDFVKAWEKRFGFTEKWKNEWVAEPFPF